MVDGSESGVEPPTKHGAGNSTACGIPNGVYLRLEQPTRQRPAGLELFGTAIIGG
jgi:hypothetical protein